MRTIDESISGHDDATTREAARDGRAARAGVPMFPLPRASAAGVPDPRAVHTTVPAQASTGVADLLRGPVRAARVLLSVPTAVYLTVPTAQGNDVVGVLTSDAARLPLGCVLFRPSNGRLLGTGSTSGRALALGMCTAIDLVDRTTRPR